MKTNKKFINFWEKQQLINRIAITTDLKKEYQWLINDLKFKHRFCLFHFKKSINNHIYNTSKIIIFFTEKKKSKSYLPRIYEVFEAKNIKEVYNIVDKLKKDKNEFPQVIKDILDKKNFYHLLDTWPDSLMTLKSIVQSILLKESSKIWL